MSTIALYVGKEHVIVSKAIIPTEADKTRKISFSA